jgi:O-antigen/teichoic acid export membrane protein
VTFLNFYYLIISVGIFFNKETKYISYAFGVAAVINVILNLIFIPLFSVWGTVIAYLVSYIAAIIFIFQKSQKSFYIPVSSWKMSYIFLTMLASVFIIIFIQENNLPWFYILAVWAGYIILLGLARVDKEFMKKPVTGTN